MPKRSGETKKHILEAAIQVVARYGLENTNAQAIADRLGISQTAVFYHFPRHGVLLDSLIDLIVEVNRNFPQKKMERDAKAVEKLKAYFIRNFEWAKKYPDHAAVLLSSMARSSHSAEMKRKVNAVFSAGEETIYALIAEGIAEKEFRAVLPPRAVARLLHKSLMGLLIANFYEGNRGTRDKDLSNLMELVGSILRVV